jgi:hypothetical protein
MDGRQRIPKISSLEMRANKKQDLESEELKIPSFKRQYIQNSIFYKSVKYFNSLPLELRTASDLKTL